MRTIPIRPLLALTALLTLLAAPAFAQNILRGRVMDEKGKPVEGAVVTLETEGTSAAKKEVKTDKKGEFMQIGLASGLWKVTANKPGIGTATTSGRVSGAAPVEVQLTLTTAAAAPTIGSGDAKAAAEMRALLDQANAAEAAKNWDEAIAKFNELIAKSPQCYECIRHVGDAQAAKKDFTAAEASYKQANAVKENAESYMGLVKIYNDQKKYDLAAEMSTKMAALAATAPGGGGGGGAEANYNTGVALFNGGKFAEAKTAFDAAAKADPNMALAHFYLGMANLNGGDLPGATAAFETYLKLDPEGAKLPASSPLKAADIKAFVASQKK